MTALILLFAATGAVWGTILVLRVPLLLACLATVLIGSCLGYEFFRFDIGPVTLTLDRLLLPLLIAAYVVQRHLGTTDPKPLSLREWLLIALVVDLILSTYTHDYHVEWGKTASPSWRLLTAYLIPALFFWIALHAPTGERQLGRLQTLFAVYGLYLAVTGILEVFEVWSLVFPRFIADPKAGIHFGRARGPMLSAVTYGLHLGTCLLWMWSGRDRWGRLAWPLLLATFPLYLAGVYYSYTRSCWMGAAAGLLVVLALSLHGRWRALVLGSAVAAGLLLVAGKSDSLLAFDREQSAEETKSSAVARLSFAHISWRMFLDRPVFGFGFGQFPRAKLPYLADRSVDLPLEAIRPLVHHNTLLCLLTETGALGLTLFSTLLLAWGWHAWKLWRDPRTPPWARRQAVLLLGVLPLYGCQLVFHEMSYSTISNSLIFALAGMTCALPVASPQTATARQRATERLPASHPSCQLGFE